MQDVYFKNFDKWNEKKKKLENRKVGADLLFFEQEVWWASLGLNIGWEIDGKNTSYCRPVLISYFPKIEKNGALQSASIQHFKSISTKRLIKYYFRISDREFEKIISIIISILPQKKSEPPFLTEVRSGVPLLTEPFIGSSIVS